MSNLAREELELREREHQLRATFPHRYAWKHYKWSRIFYESRLKENFLVAANQVGKSSVNIRKCIEWATNTELWPELWAPGMGSPNQFWYLYPTAGVATIEFKTKWSQFLPQGEAKNNPVTGWKEEMEKKQIVAIHFFSGVSVYFKTYSQNVKDLQTGTVYALFCDEELPIELLPELQARLNATDGYFHLVFTATLGQEHWRRCMEEIGSAMETHGGALKLSVSLYDCLFFEDQTKSHWSVDKIDRAKAKCPTHAEVRRRIYGRFVSASGLVYDSFDPVKNRIKKHKIPSTWLIYSGTDIGSGGLGGHPAAHVFVAVSPDYKRGIIFKAWRGDQIPTEAGDIYNKHRDMKVGLTMTSQKYDHSAADFNTITQRIGDPFVPAEKNHAIGEGAVNTLFKNGMLFVMIDEDVTEVEKQDQNSNAKSLEKLCGELTSLLRSTPKTKAADDLCDGLRYTVSDIPWDYSAIDDMIDYHAQLDGELNPPKKKLETPSERCNRERAEWANADKPKAEMTINDELEFWNNEYGT